MFSRLLPVVLALPVVASACPADRRVEPAGAGIEFDVAPIRIETPSDTMDLTVELAEREAQRIHGLMERDSLAAGAGMLFLYDEDQTADHGFWMFRTRIPLDIAYLDAGGRIVAIRTMEPCDSDIARMCPGHPPGVPWRNALEVPAGWFARHGVGVGDRVVRPPDAEESPPGPGSTAPE